MQSTEAAPMAVARQQTSPERPSVNRSGRLRYGCQSTRQAGLEISASLSTGTDKADKSASLVSRDSCQFCQ